MALFKSYFGGAFDEDAIRNNFVLIYELLDGKAASCFFTLLTATMDIYVPLYYLWYYVLSFILCRDYGFRLSSKFVAWNLEVVYNTRRRPVTIFLQGQKICTWNLIYWVQNLQNAVWWLVFFYETIWILIFFIFCMDRPQTSLFQMQPFKSLVLLVGEERVLCTRRTRCLNFIYITLRCIWL